MAKTAAALHILVKKRNWRSICSSSSKTAPISASWQRNTPFVRQANAAAIWVSSARARWYQPSIKWSSPALNWSQPARCIPSSATTSSKCCTGNNKKPGDLNLRVLPDGASLIRPTKQIHASMDFGLPEGGKEVHPQQQRLLCDWGVRTVANASASRKTTRN